MNKIRIHDEIYAIENFLSKEEIELILNECHSATEEEWNIQYTKQMTHTKGVKLDESSEEYKNKMKVFNSFWVDKVLRLPDSLDYLIDKINDRASSVYDDLYEINTLSRVQRQYPGEELKIHRDNDYSGPLDDLRYAIVVYLNDDYEGGELFFPDLDIEIKPKSGSLVTFNGGLYHGVKSVKEGPTRYVLATFAFDKEMV